MKKKNSHHPDQYFQQALEGFNATPTGKVWNGLEERLFERKTANQGQKDKKLKKTILFLTGLLLIVSAGVLVLLNNVSENAVNESVVLGDGEQNIPDVENKSIIPSTIVTPDKLIENTEDKLIAAPNNRKENSSQPLNNLGSIATIPSVLTPEKATNSKNQIVISEQIEGVKQKRGVLEQNTLENKETIEELISIPSISTTQLHSPEYGKLEGSVELPRAKFWSKITIAPWVGFGKYSKRVESNPEYDDPLLTKRFFEEREQSATSWSAGLKLAYDFSKNWRIETGLSLSNFSMTTNYPFKTVYMEDTPSQAFVFTSFNTNRISFNLDASDFESGTGGIETGDLVDVTGVFKQEIQYLSIPLAATYGVNIKRFKISLTTGITANFVMNSKLSPVNQNSIALLNYKHTFSENSSQAFLGYQGALNVSYRLKRTIRVFTGPQINGALTPANQQKPVKFYPENWNWQLGFEKHF